ncbi:MAG: hypothetical protein ACYDHB_07020 [Candidatus Dormibacteria bacterium]
MGWIGWASKTDHFGRLDNETGEVRQGLIPGGTLAGCVRPEQVEQHPADFEAEGCTGSGPVVEELERGRIPARSAEPVNAQEPRGPIRHAKADGIDARHLR